MVYEIECTGNFNCNSEFIIWYMKLSVLGTSIVILSLLYGI
jgi:hypothetical protein